MASVEEVVPFWIASMSESSGAFRVLRKRHIGTRYDWEFVVRASSTGKTVKLCIEVKSRITPQELLGVLARLNKHAAGKTPVLCCPNISLRVAQICREQQVGYLDAAGNCHISAPGFFLHIEGRHSQKRPPRDAVSLFAPKSSRVSRVLLSNVKKGWQLQELAREARISLGLASRIKQRLVQEAWLEQRDKLLYPRDPRGLLGAWRAAYDVPEHRSLYLLSDTEATLARCCADLRINWALTGFSGAWKLAPHVRHHALSAYVDLASAAKLQQLIEALGSKPVASGANLILWMPSDEFVFYGAQPIDGSLVVSPLQLYLDLSKLPGRGEDAAQEIYTTHLAPGFEP